MSKHKLAGFTLIELMIAVAIVGILAAVAYPSYVEHVTKTRRAEAQNALMSFAAAMERRYTSGGSGYLGAGQDSGGNTGAPKSAIFPSQAPLEGTTKSYNLTIQAATESTFTLRAAPISSGPQAGDGFFQLTHTGARAWDRNNDGSIASDGTEGCWEKSC